MEFCHEGLSGSRNFMTRERKISVSVVSKLWYSRMRMETTRSSLEVMGK